MIKIEIDSTTIDERTVVSKRDGQHYLIRQQSAWVNLGGKYPERCNINLDTGQAAYPVGSYLVDPRRSFEVDRYGRIALVRYPVLVTQSAQSARAA